MGIKLRGLWAVLGIALSVAAYPGVGQVAFAAGAEHRTELKARPKPGIIKRLHRGMLKALTAAMLMQAVDPSSELSAIQRPRMEEPAVAQARIEREAFDRSLPLDQYNHRDRLARNEGSPFLRESRSAHQARFLPYGPEALETRLRMIDEAEHSIDLAYFIYGHSPSGVLVTQALIAKKAAMPQVRIRILLDYFSAGGEPGLNPYEIAYMQDRGIEISFYNVATKMQVLHSLPRDHTKLFVVDGKQLVTGGRNISDDDFAFRSSGFMFTDSEVWIRGEAAQTARERFEAFWNDPAMVVRAKAATPADPKYAAAMKTTATTLAHTAYSRGWRERLRTLAEKQLASEPVFDVDSVTFVSDRPGKSPQDRVTLDYLKSRLAQARKSVDVENYIFMPEPELARLYRALPYHGVDVSVLTNGFASVGDDARLIFLARAEKEMLSVAGVRIYEHQGKPLAGTESIDTYGEPEPTAEAIHSKIGVIDEEESFILSFNQDYLSPRNKEGGVFIQSREFAARVKQVMQERRSGAKELAPGAFKYVDGKWASSGIKPWAYGVGLVQNLVLYQWFKEYF